jgi:hypothetical protein
MKRSKEIGPSVVSVFKTPSMSKAAWCVVKESGTTNLHKLSGQLFTILQGVSHC